MMLARVVAAWLVVLVVLPFTEPFPVVSAPLVASKHAANVAVATVPSLRKTRQLRLSAALLRDAATIVRPGNGPGRAEASVRLIRDRSVRELVLRL